jgi:NagD protein
MDICDSGTFGISEKGRPRLLGESNKGRPTLPKSYVIDMDGVIYQGNRLIEGAARFVEKLRQSNAKFLFLTNSSSKTTAELSKKLAHLGIEASERHFYTSALATAAFLAEQKPKGTAYVIGEAGLYSALYEVGYTISDVRSDYVVVGETRSYNFEMIEKAVRLIQAGAKFVATNPDLTGPAEEGLIPACGALTAPIERATNRKPYYIGKPNALMMRIALRILDDHSENSIIIGDRMDTDIEAGIESGMATYLVLTGVTQREDLVKYPYRPDRIFESIADIEIE